MRNIALLIEYDGTAYGGWQVQKNSESIQGVIEKSLSELLQERVKIVGAGRTDAGVHARGQVANFHTAADWMPGKLMYALNGTLPKDIAILTAAEVPESFNARFDATARRYSYRIVSHKTPIGRAFSAFFPFKLSIDGMNSAATCLIGEKSFKSFTKYADQQRHFICSVTRAEWTNEGGERKQETGDRTPDSFLLFEIEANRFLHGMVRAIVGTLIDVGRGKLTVEEFHGILKSEDRKAASMSAPACGLFLEEVKYGFDVWRQPG
ncbi:MAG: tRNA pseudouridine(38-40) synthase TruA [Bacteroidetes bacterium]|nr:tRNA pseudouridine(38-40) synthase TruA [Bacteroidota bacterium]